MEPTYKVVYWWLPAAPPGAKAKPQTAQVMEHLRLPRQNQLVTWLLPSPDTVGQEPPVVMAYGRVTRIDQVEQEPDTFTVQLERCFNGLSYAELCACVKVPVVGFHPDFGCVEGELVGLLPGSELAGIADPVMAPLVSAGEEDEDDTPVVWVDWATVWTVQGLEAPAPTNKKQSGR